ncbi:MAG: ABC transporter ATP-binding protein [Phycisphaerae bacterium]
MDVTLQASDLRMDYPTGGGDLSVLRGVSLELRAGEAAVIMGPSGSGKSTLLNILGTLERPTGGTVSIDGHNPFDVAEPDLADFRNQAIGFIFQEHHLLPHCSVMENVLIPTFAGHQQEDSAPRARALLERVGLSDRRDHRPAELSGGERQRVAVARAMINRPGVVLADEPTGNLDRASAATVAELMLEFHREEKTILIVVTHSEALAERFDRRFELKDGRLVTLPG